jgi:GT2 family glycosyltransferase
MTIDIPRSSTPRVSIIIPASSRLDLLRECLGSLARFGPAGLRYETIVVLNEADETTKAQLNKTVTGVQVVASRVNMGLAAAGNCGRSLARGELLVLLHDDAEIEPGWLEALVQAADEHPEAGAVGSKVFFPDGRLQAAGMIVWRDGSTSPPWVGEVPPASAFPELRPVDQLASCSILVRAGAWDAVGGLDERFFPLYYVDIDLSMALHRLGLVRLYQPASRIRHHQGASSTPRFRSFLIQRNRRLFAEKWGSALSEFAPPGRDSQTAVEQALARAEAFAEACRHREPLTIRARPPQVLDPVAKESLYVEKGRKVQREYVDYLSGALDKAVGERDAWRERCLAREDKLRELRARVRSLSALDSADAAVKADLIVIQESYDICKEPFSSHRRYLGRFIIRLKNLARLLFIQIFSRQVRYNAANTRLLAHLEKDVQALKQELAELKDNTKSAASDAKHDPES